jgi:hypothetical protein
MPEYSHRIENSLAGIGILKTGNHSHNIGIRNQIVGNRNTIAGTAV